MTSVNGVCVVKHLAYSERRPGFVENRTPHVILDSTAQRKKLTEEGISGRKLDVSNDIYVIYYLYFI